MKLRELFLNIINEYTSFMKDNDINNYNIIINNFLDFYGLDDINKDDSHKKIYLKVLDSFLKYYKEILNFDISTYFIYYNIKRFIYKLFISTSYLENITDLDTLINIFNNIAEIELYENPKK